jgi:tetratricopeptide (TPR) repeat protein
MDDKDRTVMLTEEESNSVNNPVEQERLTKLLDMAFWHKQAGNIKSAILAAEAAIVINKDSVSAHSLLGALYEKQGDLQKAIAHMERAVALNPNNPMDQARLDQLRHDALHQQAMSGGLINVIAARSAVSRDESRVSSNEPSSKLLPILISVAVVAGVITAGLYLTHKPTTPSNISSDYAQSQVRPGPGPGIGLVTPLPAAGPRMSMGSSPTIVSMPKATAPQAVAITPRSKTSRESTPDPFAVGAPPDPTAPVAPVKTSGSGQTSDKVKALPAITIDNSTVPPAPVTVPQTSGNTVTPLPQHTVVVDQLPTQQPSSPSSYQSQTAAPYDPGAPVPHIHITVDSDDGSNPRPTANRDNTILIGGTVPDSSSSADGLQSQALALQQQGDYGHAAQDYTKAIHLYNSQIASGHDVDTARRALRSCQTGLKICQASQ